MSDTCGWPIRVTALGIDGRHYVVLLPCTMRVGHQQQATPGLRIKDRSAASPHRHYTQGDPPTSAQSRLP